MLLIIVVLLPVPKRTLITAPPRPRPAIAPMSRAA